MVEVCAQRVFEAQPGAVVSGQQGTTGNYILARVTGINSEGIMLAKKELGVHTFTLIERETFTHACTHLHTHVHAFTRSHTD